MPWQKRLPTALTLARIICGPICAGLLLAADAVLFADGRAQAAILALAGALLFALAAATDALDGWMARRWHVTSALGASLDHAADKVLSLCAALALIATWLPIDLVIVLIGILARDAAIGGLREGLAGSDRAFGVGRLGKIKTVCLLAGLAALMGFHAAAYSAAPLGVQQGLLWLGRGLSYLALAAALTSAWGYATALLRKNNR